MCDYLVTEKEIINAEKDVFPDGGSFNDEQKKFIKCLAPCHLQAYAGTGKTSAIVGKLHVLAQKNMWKSGRGICVLSHTNVAVNEIKNRVAKHYPEIMRYPNFVGTIQEFVNEFLFVPYLASRGLKIRYQDEKRFFNWKDDLDEQQHKSVKQRIERKISGRRFLKSDVLSPFYTAYIDENGKLQARDSRDGKIKEYSGKRGLETQSVSQQEIVSAFRDIIKKQHQKGSFLFPESFIYGYEYLIEKPFVKDILSQRFQYVFLDEAQDCSKIQLDILRKLFGEGSDSVLQEIGDENQNISDGSWEAKSPLLLRKSNRFGTGIVDFVNRMRIDSGTGVAGRVDRETKKVLIVYEDAREILLRFQSLAAQYVPDCNQENECFIVSHRHEHLEKTFPGQYSEELAKNKGKSFGHFDTDREYLDLLTVDAVCKQGSKLVFDVLLSLVHKYFEERYGRKVTLSELRKTIRESEKPGATIFRSIVLETWKKLASSKKLGASDIGKLQDDLNKIFHPKKLIDFSKNPSDAFSENKTTPVVNLFPGVKIGTIHSVKGQTHDATLLLSDKVESKQDIKHITDTTPKRTLKYKKHIYVAASRSKYLFVFAIEKSSYQSLTDRAIFLDFEGNLSFKKPE